MPPIGTGRGKVNLRSGIRLCLQIVAADHLWQFIAAKGGKGSRNVLQATMPKLYSIIRVVILHRCEEKISTKFLESELGEVIKVMPHRSSSRRYAESLKDGNNAEAAKTAAGIQT